MARPSKPHLSKGVWRVRIKGTTHYLGTDERQAHAKFYRLMARGMEAPSDRPVYVCEVIERWQVHHPRVKHGHWLEQFDKFAGQTELADVRIGQDGMNLLRYYHGHLLTATYQYETPDSERHGSPRKYATSTVRAYMREATSVMRWAAECKWCDMPAVVRTDKPEFVDRSTDRVALWKALDKMDDRVGAILKFIAATGCRPGEACRLKWDDVQLAHKRAVLSRHKTSAKTGRPRVLALTDEALAVLRNVPRSGGEYVFENTRRRPFTPPSVCSNMKRHTGLTPYQLRHTFAQMCIDEGMDPAKVSRLMGHKSSDMVWTYAEIKDQDLIDVASTLTLRPASTA